MIGETSHVIYPTSKKEAGGRLKYKIVRYTILLSDILKMEPHLSLCLVILLFNTLVASKACRTNSYLYMDRHSKCKMGCANNVKGHSKCKRGLLRQSVLYSLIF